MDIVAQAHLHSPAGIIFLFLQGTVGITIVPLDLTYPGSPIEDESSLLMSTDSRISPLRAGLARLRRGALWLIFALVLLIPKMNRLRRHTRAWNFGRLIAGVAGATMMAWGAAREHKFATLAIGALVLFFALLLTPERREISMDERARQLGALIVVNGGDYIDAAGAPNPAKLFIGSNRLWVLDPALHILLEVPLQQVRALFVEPAGADWKLRLDWDQTTVEFLYPGAFGEDLARVAYETLHSLLYRELPVLR